MDHNSDITDWEFALESIQQPIDMELDSGQYSSLAAPSPVHDRADVLEPFQLPTPPQSTSPPARAFLHQIACLRDYPASPSSTTVDELNENLISVSSAFFPNAQIHILPPDLLLLSSDAVYFYLGRNVLSDSSANAFNGLLSKPQSKSAHNMNVVFVPEHSAVLNIVLHTVYGVSCAHYAPAFESLSSAVTALAKYGFLPSRFIAPATPLYILLLSQAPLYPIDLYTLAATHDMYDLAVPTSSHLLSFSVDSVSDDLAERLGAKYLRRLFFLHLGRVDALKRILLPPPRPHAPTSACSFDDQKSLTRAWALAAAYLVWNAKPDMSVSTMVSTLSPLGKLLSCDICQEGLRSHIRNAIVQWSVTKRTI
ncbi:hypothetical protein CONPUDRAFT_105432 [Coniophora puteana RWD-64-598 SS2]|uniref:BTB domain-containing protein n=1 Tax=Coniophora puteana (strain RWD-64-598) TaxID=741705 RepID=A0A5M3MN00_CONPW|nr:uncharacterized protein CONPUDRAFT_105432 [Coniophora puteana RWD-64-598 SS2]EIW80427.1 hypothetical protein CONPUDRAFT_105432 [Coniophora puteana RWD-64-598 SS2]